MNKIYSKADTVKDLTDSINIMNAKLDHMELPHHNDPDFADKMSEQNNLRFKVQTAIDKRTNVRNGTNGMWYYKCGNAPKHEVTIIYWVVGGRIRWQSTLVTIHRNQTMRFSHRTKPMYAKSWFELIDFQPIPRHLQPVMQGFQGFRYSQKLF